MFGLPLQVLIIAVMAAITVGVLGYAMSYNSIQRDKRTAQRMGALQRDPNDKKRAVQRASEEKNRRKAREDHLKTLDKKRAENMDVTNPPLELRLEQAGMTMTVKKYYTVSVIMAVVGFLIGLIFQFGLIIAAGMALVFGVGLMKLFVRMKRNKRFKLFGRTFPDAIDVIVRGVKSGLPLNDCLRIIANEAEEPVRSEFRQIVEAMQVGLSVSEATGRMYRTMPTSEANFFGIVIAIQAQAGGNLSEALGNLSHTLRERKRMDEKIKAVSSEAKTSASIIGSLPFFVATAVMFMAPHYMVPMFETPSGNIVLAVCATSYCTGIAIMKKMINFKF